MDKIKSIQSGKMGPVIFIVEGVDCSGKSTLIESLSSEYPGVVLKVNYRPKKNDKSQIITFKKHQYSILEYLNHNRKDFNIILDRFYPSEIVYSWVKRRYEAFNDHAYDRMEKVLTVLPTLYIYCSPPKETITDRLKSRGDDHIQEDDVSALIERYDRFFRRTNLRKIKLDTSKSIDVLLEEIKNKLNEH